MKQQAYQVQLGFACPRTGHWITTGNTVDMTPSEATQLVLSGYLVPVPEVTAPTVIKKGK